MSRYEVVLLDLDDTLFDHEAAAHAAASAWLRQLGCEPTELLLNAWFDAEQHHLAAWHRGEVDWTGQRRARIAELSTIAGHPIQDPAMLDTSFATYLQHYESSWTAFDDVHDALSDAAARGLKLAVLTNGQEEQQRKKLEAIGISEQLVGALSSDAIGHAKPDQRAFQTACDILGAPPSVVLHIGDRYDIDVIAARAAGLDAVHLDRHDRGPASEPARIITLRHLPRFL